ncbi:pendrin-like [Myxocyprinus asiaticus]|uniref:pendrin-like n=1 Tax=Myxocyprinus asiaticus TaxID=70543 RepID=UPI002222E13C|nr:pendrin-like [Myxocyprinus asiaticus]
MTREMTCLNQLPSDATVVIADDITTRIEISLREQDHTGTTSFLDLCRGGMAYALLAVVPPVFGFYSSFDPILIYFIFGTSRHISVGTYAVMSVMIGSVTEHLAPDSDFMLPGNDTNSTITDFASLDAERVKISATLSFLSGIFRPSEQGSRSMIQVSTGRKTQVAGTVSAVVILVILLKIRELFEELPKAVLAAIIFVNLHEMMKQCGDICFLWKTNRVDMVVWVMTLILTVLFNPDLGLAASIPFSILTVVFRTQLSKYSLFGQIPGTDIYKPVVDYNQAIQGTHL